MPRPILLYTGNWTDLTLEELAPMLNEWGYHGVELCCWGDHFEVQRALSEDDYCQHLLEQLATQDLQAMVVSNHRVSQAVCDPIDRRHQRILPDYVWADGEPEGVQERAAEEMMATVRAAEKLGVSVVSGFSGSQLWSYVAGYPGPDSETVQQGLDDFVEKWTPIFDTCHESGIHYALEIHPGQIAYDFYTAEMALNAVDGREELGFTFDPSHLHWLGVDPVEFLRVFADRIYHVHIKDASIRLNGKTSLLNSNYPNGHPRRGWEFRSPGHGGIDWEGIIRALNDIRYDGPLSVEWKDNNMDRAYGAEDACRFVKRLDFDPAPRSEDW